MPNNNTFSILGDYIDAIASNGGIPLCIPPYVNPQLVDNFLQRLDAIMFIGGADYLPKHYGGRQQPENELMLERRDSFDIYLATKAIKEMRIPVLGICGGMQLISVVCGGSLVQDIETEWCKHATLEPLQHRKGKHTVTVESDSLLFNILETKLLETNSFHHQAVNPDFIGKGLKVVARASDKIIEGIEFSHNNCEENDNRFLLGLQWHPERMCSQDELQKRIFQKFIIASKQREA